MSDYRTPTSKVRGLGASGHGASHFISQRVSAIALFFLLPVFIVLLALKVDPSDFSTAQAFFASPLGAVVTLLTLTAAFHHMRLGVQVVIEDYIGKTATRQTLLVLNTFLTAGLWLATVFFLLMLALRA